MGYSWWQSHVSRAPLWTKCLVLCAICLHRSYLWGFPCEFVFIVSSDCTYLASVMYAESVHWLDSGRMELKYTELHLADLDAIALTRSQKTSSADVARPSSSQLQPKVDINSRFQLVLAMLETWWKIGGRCEGKFIRRNLIKEWKERRGSDLLF